MKYSKCPICEQRLVHGICPMCGYDFKRLVPNLNTDNESWDILEEDMRSEEPIYVKEVHKSGKKTQKKVQPVRKKTITSSDGKKQLDKKKGVVWVVIIWIIFNIISELDGDSLRELWNFLK